MVVTEIVRTETCTMIPRSSHGLGSSFPSLNDVLSPYLNSVYTYDGINVDSGAYTRRCKAHQGQVRLAGRALSSLTTTGNRFVCTIHCGLPRFVAELGFYRILWATIVFPSRNSVASLTLRHTALSMVRDT